jgi:chromosome segregation ATPase
METVDLSRILCPDPEIALDMSKLARQGPIDSSQAENFQALILGLNEKLKTLVLMQKKLNSSEELSNSYLDSRKILEKSIDSQCKQMEEQRIILSGNCEKMQKERKIVQQKSEELVKKYRERCGKVNEFEGKNNELEGKVEKMGKEMKNFDEMEKMICGLKGKIEGLEGERNELRKNFDKGIKKHYEEIDLKNNEIDKKNEENSKLEMELLRKQDIIARLTNENNSQAIKISLLECENTELKAVVNCLKDMEKKANTFHLLAKQHQNECVLLQAQISKNTQDYKSYITLLQNEKNDLISKLQTISESFFTTKQEFNEKSNQFSSEKLHYQETQRKFSLEHKKSSIRQDLNHISSEFDSIKTLSSEFSDKLIQESEEISKTLIKSTENFLNSCRLISQIQAVIEDRDNEISILRQLIAELQNKTVYYPITDDPVDEAIAGYINSRTDPLPVSFVREEFGVYLFGTKRVFIKIENNKLTSIV